LQLSSVIYGAPYFQATVFLLRRFDHLSHISVEIGSGVAIESLNLKPYSTTFCNLTETHDESAVGWVETK